MMSKNYSLSALHQILLPSSTLSLMVQRSSAKSQLEKQCPLNTITGSLKILSTTVIVRIAGAFMPPDKKLELRIEIMTRKPACEKDQKEHDTWSILEPSAGHCQTMGIDEILSSGMTDGRHL